MRLVVFISGSGTNLQALIDACAVGSIRAEIVLVVSNRKDAYGLERARQAGIETLYFPLKPYKEAGKSREDYDADLAAQVQAVDADLVVLAGWMHILSPAFLDQFPRQVINLHPALPGEYPGVKAMERAYEAAQRSETDHSGVMVHYAIPAVDAGDVIIQSVVPILPQDSFAAFKNRMHATEHQLIVQAVALLADRKPS